MTALPPNQADPAPGTQPVPVPGQVRPAARPPTHGAPGADRHLPAADAGARPVRFDPVPAAGAPPRRRRRLVLAAITALVLAVVGAAGAWAAQGEIPRGALVLDVDLGTLSVRDAQARLAGRLAGRVDAPVRVVVAGRAVEVRPGEVGLAVDVPASVRAAAKGLPRPWGARRVAPVVSVDAAKLDAVLRRAVPAERITRRAPDITFDGITPKPSYPTGGLDLDPARSAELVRAGWLVREPIEIPLVELPPAMTREAVDALVRDVARPAVAAPVQVTTPRGTFTVTPKMIAASLVFTPDPTGALVPSVDAAKLRAAIGKASAGVEVRPEEARISVDGGAPRVLASSPGQLVDTAKLAADLLAALRAPAPRQVAALLATTPAKTTDADLTALGVREKVSTFTTKFTGGLSSPRSRNIVTIAKEVDGALVRPGEVFSLNGHTGERGYRQGYQDAPVIIDGKLTPGVGGGASQFTTTLFNAAYYAGLEDVEHKPHSFYFSRYPEVIEATIFYPTLDLKFRNDTPYGVLIDTSYTRGSITVTLWSTRYYDRVTSEKGPRRNITSPRTVHRTDGDKCIPTEGLPGFAMDVWRVVHRDGREVKREKFSWKYDPEPRFVCDK